MTEQEEWKFLAHLLEPGPVAMPPKETIDKLMGEGLITDKIKLTDKGLTLLRLVAHHAGIDPFSFGNTRVKTQ